MLAQDAPPLGDMTSGAGRAVSSTGSVPADAPPLPVASYVHELTGATGVHDLAADPFSNDVVWLAETTLGALGRYDARTGEVGHVSLGNGAAPRAVAAGPNRRVFLADPVLDVIHEVEADGEVVHRHAMPSGLATDLTGLAVDAAGRAWFTAYDGYIGRLEAGTGKVSLVRAPGGRGPSAVAVGSHGGVWCSRPTLAITSPASTLTASPSKASRSRRAPPARSASPPPSTARSG